MGEVIPVRDFGCLSQTLREQAPRVAHRWLSRLSELGVVDRGHVIPGHQLSGHVPAAVVWVAACIEQQPLPPAVAEAQRRAATVGRDRYHQRATARQVLREYDVLGDLIASAVAASGCRLEDVQEAMSSAERALSFWREETLAAFVGHYTETIDRQTEQLRSFSRLVSHEVRQPLAVLEVITKTLSVNAGDMDSVRAMDIFSRSVTRLADVTGRLERFARIADDLDFSSSERDVALTGVVESVATELATLAAARQVEMIVRPNLPTLVVDRARAELIFMNLVANSIQYSDPRKAHRFVEIAQVDGESPSVLVRDNGIGLPGARLQDMFREFVRAHGQRNDRLRGSALGPGLTIVRESMDALNGSVRIESREGEGTTVRLTWNPR